ncbi:dipeptidase C isoform X3 [Lycorma delicatula]|uniref:dipeptidase C isoform X3 n=1 Tax=Lycorma delicatula TaxID=130591 RepID=UPI003F510B59
MAAGAKRAFFSMGEHTLKVPMELFAINRRRLAERLKKVAPNTVVVLQGGQDVSLYCTDVDYKFQQESYFNWMFGVREPGFYGALDVNKGRSFLFIPRLPEEYSVFLGKIKSTDDFKAYYDVDEVHYNDQIKDVLKSLNPKKLLTLHGLNTDSGYTCKEAVFEGISEFNVDNSILHPEIAECRVIKTPEEIEVIRYTNKISSEAHKVVMQKIHPGMYEYQGEAIFLEYCYYVGGARSEAYTCICGSGENAAILHYGHAGAPNDKRIEDGDLCLFDMGCKYAGYTSDITVTFPASGKFTEDQKAIYNAVLIARTAVIENMKPGVSWVDMHRLAFKMMLTYLKKFGLLVGDVDEMIEAGIGAILQPHGLGHLLGCDVHDVGGYLDGHPTRPAEPGFNKLRTARTLLPGMVLTVEPGCYFNDVMLQKAMKNPDQAKFFNAAVLERVKNVGSVRIEDDVLVTDCGAEILTDVPRTVEEIEEFILKAKRCDSGLLESLQSPEN